MPNNKLKRFGRKPSQAKKSPSGQAGKRKPLTTQQIEAALVSAGKMSANKAADLHGVPRLTLKDRLNRRVIHGTNPGPVPYLSRDEEMELSTHLLQATSMGLGKTCRDVLSIVGLYVKNKGIIKGKGRDTTGMDDDGDTLGTGDARDTMSTGEAGDTMSIGGINNDDNNIILVIQCTCVYTHDHVFCQPA